MQTQSIDLYEYFGLKRQAGASGYLTTYVHDQSKEYCESRLRPAMLVIPGGGYHFCSDREAEPIAISFLEKGYNSFVLNYSVNPVSFPSQLIEGAMAIAYIRENADKFNILPDKVGAVGFSAGGHLTGMLATMFNHSEVRKALKDRANLCRPDAVILSYPVISAFDSPHIGSFENLSGGNEKLYKELTLEDKVTKESSPAFIWSTFDDATVPVQNSMLMAESYLKNNVSYELHIFHEGRHGISLSTVETSRAESINELNKPHVANWFNLATEWLLDLGFKIKL